MKISNLIAILLAFVMTAVSAAAQDGYRIRTGDTLTIEVLEDPSLNRSTLVLPDGRFSFPFAGTLTGAGKTVGQIEQTITAAILPNFTTSPNVFVSVTPDQKPRSSGGGTARGAKKMDIYFLGEVSAPGLKEMDRGTTFLQAMAASGGFSKYAATKRVQLRRTERKSGKQTLRIIDYRAISLGKVIGNDFRLQDGDVILVPERRLFE